MSKDLLEILAIVTSLVTFFGGAIALYRANVKKEYAASRDFAHLKRSYEQLAAGQVAILKEIDRHADSLILDVRELKSQMNVLFIKILPEASLGSIRAKSDKDD